MKSWGENALEVACVVITTKSANQAFDSDLSPFDPMNNV
jgi:hypothetical protein